MKKINLNREHFLILNVAVGGTGYFPDTVSKKGGKFYQYVA